MVLLINKKSFGPDTPVLIARPDEKEGWCGFQDHIKGVRALILERAITTWRRPAWIVQFVHPISQRLVSCAFLEDCLELV